MLLVGGAQVEILWTNHDDPLTGHFSFARILELVWWKYYWPRMAKEIKVYSRSCIAYQQVKPTHHKPYGELQSLAPPCAPYSDLSKDFIVRLPLSEQQGKAYNTILVIIFILFYSYTDLAIEPCRTSRYRLC